MTQLRATLRQFIFTLFVLFSMGSMAFAACSDLLTLEETDLTPTNIREVQQGLRTAYQDQSRWLIDGELGKYTRERLEDLCQDVARPAGVGDVRSTLDLTVQYARLENSLQGWAGALFDIDLEKRDTALGLRLAGGTAMASVALGRNTQEYTCTDPGGALAQYPDAKRALNTLTRLYKDPNNDKIDVLVCVTLPVAGGIDAWQQSMDRLGRIASRRVGALRVLRSDEFLDWIASADDDETGGTAKRLRRLVGTEDAVVTLIDEYNAQNETGDGSTVYHGGPCSPRQQEQTLTYYALNDDDIASLDFFVSLTPKLDAFNEAHGGFDSAQALWRELRPALAQDLDECVLDEIEDLVTGPETLPLTFLLKPSATETLMARADLETALPVLSELATMRTGTKSELVNRIKAGLTGVQQAMVDEQVDAAADTLAAASEPVPPPTDTAIIELDLEGEPDPAPTITVTDATDRAVATAIDNPAMSEALQKTPFTDATGAEIMRSQVRAALETTARRQAQDAVENQIVQIEPAVISEWTLSEPLRDAILALPYVRAALSDQTALKLPERLKTLNGVAYPSHRLFEEALKDLSNAKDAKPFSPFIIERITQKAQKNITDPDVTRVFGPFEIDECNCTPDRSQNKLSVYGFYPFWLAPTPPPRAAPDDAPAQPPQTKIDFSVTGQVAFYGMEFSDVGTSKVTLRHRDQWRAARRNFVNSAHQYRAKADVAFDLRGWEEWNITTIDEVIEDITKEMGAFERLPSLNIKDVRAMLPTLFDPVQPDGVTLIFHGYQGFDLGKPEMKTMVTIVKELYEALPNRANLDINVAFDFPLIADDLSEPLFDELYELVVTSERITATGETPEKDSTEPEELSRETTKIINKILLFLERPTTDSKKGLRFRMEQGLFQGELRAKVLRNIIPVLPPSGHEFIKTTLKPNAVDRTPPKIFSQYDDDIVYFKDNFSGVGFWPVLDPSHLETKRLSQPIIKYFNQPRLKPNLAVLEAPLALVCDKTCPNRAYIILAAIALSVILSLLTWRSFYSGFVHKVAFRFMAIGVVWAGNFVLVGTLFVLGVCDPQEDWYSIVMWFLIIVLGGIMLHNAIYRVRNGPMP